MPQHWQLASLLWTFGGVPVQEASLMAAIRHPNIVATYGTCAEPPALIMEYCARKSLTGEAVVILQGVGVEMGHRFLGQTRAEPQKAQAVTLPIRGGQ
jgi:hypothetical protein